jgi:hypothetical protein
MKVAAYWLGTTGVDSIDLAATTCAGYPVGQP